MCIRDSNNINDENENDISNSDNNQSGLKRILLGTTVLTDRQESNQMKERVKWNWDFGERGKQMSSEKNILEQSRDALYHNLHDIEPKIEPEAHWLLRNMECYSSHHNDNPAWRVQKSTCHGRGQCRKMCSILDVDDVDVSESMWAHVSSLLAFVLVGALDQTGLARSKRMYSVSYTHLTLPTKLEV